MGSRAIAALPEGFVLDPSPGELPPGFQLDTDLAKAHADAGIANIQALPPVKEPSIIDTLSHPIQNIKEFYGIKDGKNEDSWGDTVGKSLKSTGLQALSDTGAAAQWAGESLANVGGKPAYPHPLPSPVDAIQWIGKKTAELGDQAADYWNALAEQARPKVEDGTAKYYVAGATQSVGNNLVHLVAGALAKNPNIALAGMGGEAGANQYHALREKDVDHTKATMAALGYTGAEIVPEIIPVGILFDPKLGFLKRTLLSTLTDIPGELTTTVVENGIIDHLIDPKTPWGDLKKQLKDTLVITALSAPVLGAGAHAVHVATGSDTPENQAPPPAPPAEAAPAQAPPAQTPAELPQGFVLDAPIPVDRRNSADLPPVQPDGTTSPMSAEEAAAHGAPVAATRNELPTGFVVDTPVQTPEITQELMDKHGAEPGPRDANSQDIQERARAMQRKAIPYQDKLNEMMATVVNDLKLPSYMGRLKSVRSTVQKVERSDGKYRNVGDINDHTRGIIIMNSWADAPRVIQDLRDRFQKAHPNAPEIRFKVHDYVGKPKGDFGLQGIQIGVRMGEDVGSLIQLHTPDSFAVYSKTDKIYRNFRNADPQEEAYKAAAQDSADKWADYWRNKTTLEHREAINRASLSQRFRPDATFEQVIERKKIPAVHHAEARQIYDEAVKAQEVARRKEVDLRYLLERVRDKLGLKTTVALDKKIDRVVEKVLLDRHEPGGNPNKTAWDTKDLTRGTVIINKWDELPSVIAELQKTHQLTGKNTIDLATDPFGFRGAYLVADMGDGIRAEIQVHTPETKKIVERTHPLFERWRAVKEEDVLSPNDLRQMILDRDASVKEWNDYWGAVAPEVRDSASAAVNALARQIDSPDTGKPFVGGNQAPLSGSKTTGGLPSRMGDKSTTVLPSAKSTMSETESAMSSSPSENIIVPKSEENKGNSYEAATARPAIEARQGRVDSLEIPGEKPIRIQYAVVEAKDIQPSHNADTFSKNPVYPDGVQERRYHADDAESGKVMDGARNLKPQYVLTDNPDGANGPPVILANGLVMGGNGRSMMIKRNYSSGGTAYKSALEEAAPRFGIDAAQVKGMDQPVLVRVLAETPTNRDAARELVSNLNRTATQALEPTAAAVSAGERVSTKTQEWLAGKLDDLGEEATIAKLIASPNQAAELFRRLMADGVISKQDQRKYYNPDTDKFTDQGKLFIENAIMGNVINDAELLDGMTPSIRQKLARALAPLARMKTANKEWNLIPTIKESVSLINEATAEGERVSKYLKTLEKQVSMFEAPREIPVVVKNLAKFIDGSTQTEIKRALTRWADEATRGSSNQGELLGMMAPQKSPGDLVKELFSKAKNTLKTLEDATNQALNNNLPLAQLEGPMGMAATVVNDTIKGPDVSFPDPQIEARFTASKGLSQVGIFNKLRAYLIKIGHDFTRTWEHIPRGEGRFAQFSFDLTTLAKQGEVAKARTIKIFQGYFHKFGPKKFDLFTRSVFLNDLGFEVKRGHALPWGFTPEKWADAKAKIDKLVEANPDIKDAVEKRRQVWDALKAEYTEAMSEIGIDVSERFKNPDYIHHEVLKYAELEADKRDKARGGTKAPTGRGFMKTREGSSLDINSNFLEAEAKVMAQMMYDVEIAKFIAKTREGHDIAGALRAEAKKRNEEAISADPALVHELDGLKGSQRRAKIKELLGDKLVTWKSLIPEDHEIWQPRDGNVLYWAYSMPDQLVDNAIEGMVPVKGIHEALVQGGPRSEYVLPKEIVATLNEFHKEKPHFVAEASAYIQRHWKILMLISPGRVLKYNIRNEIGDLDHVLAGAPGALNQYGRAIKELYSSMISERGISPDLQDWMDRGGPWSTLQYQEMADINKVKALVNILEKPSNRPDQVIARWFNGYWQTARKWTDFRESGLRYAAYLHFLEGIKKTGKVQNYAASLREEIDALKDPKDKAFKLANELMGSYDTVSVAGRQIRRHLIPFWSFQETNMQTYKRLFQNARIDGGNAGTILRVAGVKLTGATMKGTILAARTYVGAAALIAITQAWNLGMYPDDEEELDQFNRNRPHLLLGRDADGTVRYFSGLGSLGDAVAWVGLDSIPGQINDWIEGRRSLLDVLEEMAKSPINKLAQGISPIWKTPAELAARKQLFPDVFHPTPIKDRGQYIARMLVFDNLYKELADMPSRGLADSVKDLFYYRIAPNQGAYNDIQGLKEDFLAKKGIERENWVSSSKSRAAYFYKLAIRLGDKETAAKWLDKYAEEGGTHQGLEATLKGMQPLGGLSRKETAELMDFLGTSGRRKLDKAYNYYYDVLLGKKE